jgi:hypothetical protein
VRITTREFPHSEIRGSKVVQHLTAAYRSRPRPSSAPGAKASTACPSYLDDLSSTPLPTLQFSRYDAGEMERSGSPTPMRSRPSRLNSMLVRPCSTSPQTPRIVPVDCLVVVAVRPGVDVVSRASAHPVSDRGSSTDRTNLPGAQATVIGSHP